MKAVKSTSERRVAETIAAPHAGQIVGERYRLEEWLESGAMGSIWRAEQIRLGSAAAVKFLEPSLIQVPEMLERFLQEARSAAAVQSAHVIQVFDYGSEGGLPYIAMEFLEGENLYARLARSGRLTPGELDKIFREVARGLGQAHELGVIHRDVKPANIFLAREGKHEVTKLIDFGIAKVQADALRVSQVGTQLGMLLGTPQYMSPEQMRGSLTLDDRTDLWALAIIACECLTGRHAFPGTTIGDLTVQICTEEPLAPSTLGDVPAGFDQWFFKATRKDPSQRFASAADMADALTRILLPNGRAPISVRNSSWGPPPRARQLPRAWSALARLRTRAGNLGRAAIAESVVVVTRSLREPAARRLWTRAGAAGLALLVAAGLLLLARPRGAPGPNLETQVAAQAPSQPREPAVEARVPVAPAAAAQSPPSAPAVDARPAPVQTPKARRRGRRQSPSATSDPSTGAPLNPMSEGMRRLGALIAERSGEKRRAVRPEKPGPDGSSDRAEKR